jgi:hypothetical protein
MLIFAETIKKSMLTILRIAIILSVFLALDTLRAQSEFNGKWVGEFSSQPLVVEVAEGGRTAIILITGRTERLKYVGYNPDAPSVYYWREQDHAVVCIHRKGQEVFLSYLEEDTARTVKILRKSSGEMKREGLEGDTVVERTLSPGDRVTVNGVEYVTFRSFESLSDWADYRGSEKESIARLWQSGRISLVPKEGWNLTVVSGNRNTRFLPPYAFWIQR